MKNLRKWMREQGCWDQYKANFKAQRTITLTYYAKISSVYLIAAAFDWSDTPEGSVFWCNINDQWYKELENHA